MSGELEVVTCDSGGGGSVATLGARRIAGQQPTLVWGTAVDATGAIAVTGIFGGTIDFGTGPLTTHGQDDSDIFIAVVNPPDSPAVSSR